MAWPLGRLVRPEPSKRYPNGIDHALCIMVETHEPSPVALQVWPMSRAAPSAHIAWPPPDSLRGVYGSVLHVAYTIGSVMLADGECVIVYRGADDDAPSLRRIGKLYPYRAGRAIQAHDLDLEAPRTFRLERILEVRSV
jgi:hypothetical protein